MQCICQFPVCQTGFAGGWLENWHASHIEFHGQWPGLPLANAAGFLVEMCFGKRGKIKCSKHQTCMKQLAEELLCCLGCLSNQVDQNKACNFFEANWVLRLEWMETKKSSKFSVCATFSDLFHMNIEKFEAAKSFVADAHWVHCLTLKITFEKFPNLNISLDKQKMMISGFSVVTRNGSFSLSRVSVWWCFVHEWITCFLVEGFVRVPRLIWFYTLHPYSPHCSIVWFIQVKTNNNGFSSYSNVYFSNQLVSVENSV